MERYLIIPDAEPIDDAENQDPQPEPEPDNFESAMKRARLAIPVAAGTKYMNLNFIKPDTNVVERLFSLTNKVWVEGRKSMTPGHTELLLLLKCNRDLWDANLVYKCRSDPRQRPALAQAQPLQDAEEAAQDFADMLDDPEMGAYQNAFLLAGEDADFWDDDNIAAMLGNLD